MNFIFAKLFEEYVKKNDSPKFTITLYISIFYFLLTFVILLPIKTYIDKLIFSDQIHYQKFTIIITVFAFLLIITYAIYYIYIRKELIYKLTDKYKTRKINKIILYLIIAISPVTLLLLAATITVFLNGGQILGNEVKGLLK